MNIIWWEAHSPEAVENGVAVVKAEPGHALHVKGLPVHPDQLPLPGGQVLRRILQTGLSLIDALIQCGGVRLQVVGNFFVVSSLFFSSLEIERPRSIRRS